MTHNEYVEAIKQAEAAVTQIQDPRFKEIAFQIILTDLLNNTAPNAQTSSKQTNVNDNSMMDRGVVYASIIELIEEGYFNMPRPVADVLEKLKEKGKFYDRKAVDKKLRLYLLGDKLLRIKEKGMWNYVVKR